MSEGSESSKSCTKGASMLRERRREAGPGRNGSVRETGLGRDTRRAKERCRRLARRAGCDEAGLGGIGRRAPGAVQLAEPLCSSELLRGPDSRRCCLAFDAAFRWGSLPDCLIASKAGATHRAWRWPAGTSPKTCLRELRQRPALLTVLGVSQRERLRTIACGASSQTKKSVRQINNGIQG